MKSTTCRIVRSFGLDSCKVLYPDAIDGLISQKVPFDHYE
jgi:hypothetical protein